MAYLIDTTILARLANAADAFYPVATRAVLELHRHGEVLHVTPQNLVDEFEVASFVMVSTDNAVHPTSVMGASKHLAENYVHALSLESRTRFVVTRFDNVLGSAGSVVPIFQDQIRRDGEENGQGNLGQGNGDEEIEFPCPKFLCPKVNGAPAGCLPSGLVIRCSGDGCRR